MRDRVSISCSGSDSFNGTHKYAVVGGGRYVTATASIANIFISNDGKTLILEFSLGGGYLLRRTT